MPKVKQITVRCENRPGTLAQIAAVLGEVDVNILGFLLITSGTKGHVKLIVDDVKKATSLRAIKRSRRTQRKQV